jgi:asparagine synthase (glutamine-hydrolysing)
MCGVLVQLNKSNSDPNSRIRWREQSLLEISHRGPDNSGIWESEYVWLGHTRLSIQDLSYNGSQPMISRCKNFVIVFNGEIYNHFYLRKKYLQDFQFRGNSDTETILELFALYGSSMLQFLNGMWSIAIWDILEQNLFVSRDRFGQKPLYYLSQGNELMFSSEIKPLVNLLSIRKTNNVALSEYLSHGNYDHLLEFTFFENIKQLRPSTFAHISIKDLQISPQTYWTLKEISYEDRVPFDTTRRREFRILVQDAISSQLLSDVNVGATLSGGLDSSIIVGNIASQGSTFFPVFTAQFPGNRNDETIYVKSFQQKWGKAIKVHYLESDSLNLSIQLSKSLAQQEEPFGDPSIIAHTCLMNDVKKLGVTVLLGGQGGDEVSMGYPWMYERLFSYALRSGDFESFLNFILHSRTSMKDILRLVLSSKFPQKELELRLNHRNKSKFWLSKKLQLDSPINCFSSSSDFYGIFKESLKTIGLPHLTHYDDRSSMAFSIEGRMPFLDHRIIEFTNQLKVEAFYKKGYSKWLFRETFHDLLPENILKRKDKVGFYTPTPKIIYQERKWIIQIM